jgi:hypothetical protein
VSRRIPGTKSEVEIEGRVKLVVAQVPGDPGRREINLATQDRVAAMPLDDLPPATVDLVNTLEVHVRKPVRLRGARRIVDRGRLEVRQPRRLHQKGGDIYPEAIDAEVEPEVDYRLELGSDFRVVPVEVGL